MGTIDGLSEEIWTKSHQLLLLLTRLHNLKNRKIYVIICNKDDNRVIVTIGYHLFLHSINIH